MRTGPGPKVARVECMRTLVVGLPACTDDHARTAHCAYQVAWSINPHMVVGSVDSGRAMQQHAAFVRALRRYGARVVTIPFVHGAYDSIFAKDSAILALHDGQPRALLAQPRFSVRRVERIARARHLSALGFDIDRTLSDPLEGGDVVVLPDASCALLGHGLRSSEAAASTLARFLGIEVVTLELVDPALHHLDMALTVLADGTVLVCEAAFTPAALRKIHALPCTIIPVSRAEASQFALDIVELGSVVLTGANAPEVAAALQAAGREVVTLPLDEFHRAGGSAGSLISQIYLTPERRGIVSRHDTTSELGALVEATAA